jgi:anti-sigma factor RsiW
MSCEHWAENLDAYVDGELSREDLASAEEHLRTCDACAREALGRMQLKRATQRAAQRYAPAPELRHRVRQSLRKQRRSPASLAWRPGLLALAAVLICAVASVLVHSRQAETGRRAFAEIVDLHVATLASANPVDVISTDRHTVKPWFQGRLPFSFNLPEFAGTPFKLAGGRVAYLDNRAAAQLLLHSGNHIVSVFILQDSPAAIPAGLLGGATRVNGFNIESWSASGLRYLAIGDANAADLHALAELLKAAARQS